ncbi:hypothetical protein PLEOSDRAFT_1044739 [Pleurotus ostreatus PC15]|uniref:CRAL-TRIO domain-containing protein n=1 Tax=Pleurotus ostreatus (strain PC15) TaxID=1137138 RepID=A0A067NBM4_PLEO1|nr:hypothetical protein PLEOSDRAFT_1044739 [Pleurotus ostreatus PC15]
MSANVTFDPLAGHLHHLTAEQIEAFIEFKDNLALAGLYTHAAEPESPTASHDDPTLLRFLRARRFHPGPAQRQFADTEQWRKEHGVEGLYKTFDPQEFESAKRFYPRWTGRRDKHGLPLYVYKLAAVVPLQKELDAVPPVRRYQRIVALYEFMCNFALPLCSHLPHATAPTPVSSVMTIIDLKGVALTSMWYLRSHLQEASRLATANYPETLHAIAVVNSPGFFPTIWGWIKGWFDENTRNKIHVLGRDPGPTLCELVHAADLPKEYGGELGWTFTDEPMLDDEAKAAIGEMPKGPVKFVDGSVVRLYE